MIRAVRRAAALAAPLLLSAAAWPQPSPQNVLVVIADDVGVDMIGAYQPLVGSQQVPPTPTIDGLAAQGIVFRDAWSNPLCATTRATIQTGRYGHRTGIRGAIATLADAEVAIPEVIAADPVLGYTSAVVGKWGLGGTTNTTHAVRTGYDFFAGRPGCCRCASNGHGYANSERPDAGCKPAPGCDPADPGWHQDSACIASAVAPTTVYATTASVDDATAWLGSLPPDQPWLLLLSFNAAHSPFDAPPDALHSYPTPLACPGDALTCYRAMIEALDRKLGELLASLAPEERARTTVIFLGDNGAPATSVAPFDPDRSKFTLFQGGVNVPLIVAGAAVAGPARVSDALVNTSDLFMTVLDLAGVATSALPTSVGGAPWLHDSFSLTPILEDACAGGCGTGGVRHFAYSESQTGKTIRNRAGYKLLMDGGLWYFYLLAQDPYENANLVDEATGELLQPDPVHQAALDDLRARLGDPGPAAGPPLPPNLPAANLDPDADGVAQDGDGSGVAGDAPCPDGQIGGCDDNCPLTANPEQGDADADGVGDACDGACVNGLDDDGDGLTDYPADPGCRSAGWETESPQCENGLDDDGDGRIDYDGGGGPGGPDPACDQPWRLSELRICQDGLDNDGDGRLDFDGGQSVHGACSGGVCPPGVSDPDGDGDADPDPHCSSFIDETEDAPSGGCGFGPELALLAPLLARLRRYRRRRADPAA